MQKTQTPQRAFSISFFVLTNFFLMVLVTAPGAPAAARTLECTLTYGEYLTGVGKMTGCETPECLNQYYHKAISAATLIKKQRGCLSDIGLDFSDYIGMAKVVKAKHSCRIASNIIKEAFEAHRYHDVYSMKSDYCSLVDACKEIISSLEGKVAVSEALEYISETSKETMNLFERAKKKYLLSR